MNRTTVSCTSIRSRPNYLYDYNYINNYRTVNNFNGGELGLNAVYTFGRWSLDVVGKAAIGVNNQYVSLYNQQTIDVSNARAWPRRRSQQSERRCRSSRETASRPFRNSR